MIKRMIFKTPMVHKLEVLSSCCLADCSKYVREGQWRRVNVLPHVGGSFLLLGSEERECVLCHVGWSGLLLGGEKKSMCSVMLAGLSRCWPVGKREKEEKWLALSFMLPRGDEPGSNSHWVKYINSNSNDQSNSSTK